MSKNNLVYGGVREIFSSKSGLYTYNVKFFHKFPKIISGDPKINPKGNKYTTSWKNTEKIRAPLGDFNKTKFSVREFKVKGKSISVGTGLTDYFTLWSLPQTNPELHKTALNQIISNGKTNVPIAISTHNILLTPKGVLVRVSSKGAGFSAGRVSISFEEQAEPTLDSHPINTAYRGYQEELGKLISPEKIMLLGVALELNTSYACFCYIAKSNFSKEVIENATDRSETEALFFVPPNDLDPWAQDEIPPAVWEKYADKSCPIDSSAILKPHPTVLWRIKLLKQYLSI